MTILRSWVGTTAIGQPHTGCPRYTVNPRYLKDPSLHHQHYLALEGERARIETTFSRLERKERWTTRDEETFTSLLARYKQILAQQAELRLPALYPDLPALTVSA